MSESITELHRKLMEYSNQQRYIFEVNKIYAISRLSDIPRQLRVSKKL
jgi:hypothetical protein